MAARSCGQYPAGLMISGLRELPMAGCFYLQGNRRVKLGLMRLLLAFSVSALAIVHAQTAPEVTSPDGSIKLALSSANGQLAYAVTFHGKPVIAPSVLGLDIQDQQPLGAAVNITGST